MTREISSQRKGAYYAGAVLMGVGFFVFLSTFVSFATRFGDPSSGGSLGSSMMLRPAIGMVLILLGGLIRSIGARGLAGSGVVLNPSEARRDLEPFSRMAGGMLHDALDEADLNPTTPRTTPVVMIKCRACGKLNEEDSKFCQECGKPL